MAEVRVVVERQHGLRLDRLVRQEAVIQRVLHRLHHLRAKNGRVCEVCVRPRVKLC